MKDGGKIIKNIHDISVQSIIEYNSPLSLLRKEN
jgi:hypothetical protein